VKRTFSKELKELEIDKIQQLGKKQRTFCIMGQQVNCFSKQKCVAKAMFKNI